MVYLISPFGKTSYAPGGTFMKVWRIFSPFPLVCGILWHQSSTFIHMPNWPNGRACVWRFGHLAYPCKKPVENEVHLRVNTRIPSRGLGRGRTVHEPCHTSRTNVGLVEVALGVLHLAFGHPMARSWPLTCRGRDLWPVKVATFDLDLWPKDKMDITITYKVIVGNWIWHLVTPWQGQIHDLWPVKVKVATFDLDLWP